jgi:hypothetical protein
MSFVKKIKKKSGTYLCEVEGYRDENGKVRHRFIRSLGKLDEEGNRIPRMKIEHIQAERVRLHGPVHALCRVTEDIGLEDILEEYAPEVLTLIYSHILRPEGLNNMKRVLDWIDTEEMGLHLPVSRKRFENAMDYLAKHIQDIERELYTVIGERCAATTLFYDLTDIYFYGKSVWMARSGYNSHHTSLPQVGIGLAVESDHGIPLFHHLFSGNVFDARTFPVIIQRLQECGREGCTLIFDRGIATKATIKTAMNHGFSVIACLALRGKIKQIARETAVMLDSRDMVRLSSIFILAREVRHTLWGMPVRLMVCINEPLQQEIRQRRYRELALAIERLEQGLPCKKGCEKYLKEEKGSYSIDHDVLHQKEQYDGVYVIITTTDLPREKVIQKYFERDRIEKAFRVLKQSISLRPVRHWLMGRVKAHVFICYLAYLHLSWMEMLLKEKGIKMSARKALQNLESIYRVKLTDTHTGMSTMRTVPLTKEQEKVYEALNLLS